MADEDLPMLTSDFYSKHMLPAKPDGKRLTMLDREGYGVDTLLVLGLPFHVEKYCIHAHRS